MSKTTIRAIIVDDEELARENLRMLLEEYCPVVEVVDTADGVRTARASIESHDPDLVFLDIRMPSGSEGLDLIGSIPDPRFLVVFVTAFKDHAIEAFHANAVHYVLKPIDHDDLTEAVDKATLALQGFDKQMEVDRYHDDLEKVIEGLRSTGTSSRLTVDHAKGFKVFQPQRILRLEADGNCTRLFFVDGDQYLDTRTLKVYEEMLTSGSFIGCIVLTSLIWTTYVEYLRDDGHYAIMSDGTRVPIARDRTAELIQKVKQTELSFTR